MRRQPNCLIEIVFIFAILALVAALVLIALSTNPVHAADNAPYVCRDTTYEAGIRYQFRNIPLSWSTEIGYWYVADDGNMSDDGTTFTADALTSYPLDASGIKVGEAVFGANDYSLTLRGTADTEPCDPPPETTPTAPQCPAWAIDSETGELICLWDLPKATS